MTKILATTALAASLALPMAAQSATLTPIDDTDITDAVASEAAYIWTDSDDFFSFNQTFSGGVVSGNKSVFDIINNGSSATTLLAGQSASVNPDDAFVPVATFSWDGGIETNLDGGNISAAFAVGQTRTLTITYGNSNSAFQQVDVFISAVPLPAAGGMLLTAMVAGGIAARRKKKAA